MGKFTYIPNYPFVDVPNALVEDERLIIEARFLYVVLLAHSKEEPQDVDWNMLCHITGYSLRAIKKYLRQLEDCGWIVRKSEDNFELVLERR